ncbi:MAG: cell division ATP-binding protein FtsE [Desulfosarcinaceae bacterium]|jgi:cell division transport system ATP-binding protein
MQPAHPPAIIRLYRVIRRYGVQKALDAVSLEIPANAFVFVTGPSGAGKTTLLKLLYLGLKANEGQVIVDGMNLARMDRHRIPILRRRLGIIFQDYKLIATRSVYENVALVLEAAGTPHRAIAAGVNSVLRTVGMEKRRDALPPSLSGGEQQRVAVARALVGEPRILLADEPTGSLDSVSAGVVMDLITRFHQRGGTVLVATHDQHLIRSVPARVIHLEGGKLVEILPCSDPGPLDR